MPTVEHSMWVTKRKPALRNQLGFVKVPAALRAGYIADGTAQDVFDAGAAMDNTPLGPAITDIAFAPVPVAVDSPVGTTAGTLTVDGGTAPFTFGLTGADAANFTVQGATVKTAVTPLREGTHSMYVTASDSGGRSFVDPLTVDVSAVVETSARTRTRK